jgi:hypothetical protein
MQNQFAFSGSTNASCIAATRSTAIKKPRMKSSGANHQSTANLFFRVCYPFWKAYPLHISHASGLSSEHESAACCFAISSAVIDACSALAVCISN